MSTSELVTSLHLQKKAIIYIRQSTPHQQISNQESLRLQYALQERAQRLGWHAENVEIIDADLGLTAASAQHRTGFQELVAKVTLDQVGVILSVDVTRLSRNCSDWYPLLDVCGYWNCLSADNDGIYDPGSANGRLLLGLKGQLSELELHTIRARMTAGLLNTAKRGELALTLPVGLVRDALDRVHKDLHQEVVDRLELVFTTFLRLRSASKVLGFLNAQDLALPRRDRFGDLVWKKPTVAMILQILKHPAYAGAFVYGRTRTLPRNPAALRSKQIRLPIEQWRIRVNEVYPAYISWETFERIQAMLLDNYAEYDHNKSRGVPRPGAALLHGMVYCGECGHKLVVQYKGGTRYLCNFLRQKYRVPVCQHIPGDAVDPHIVQAFFQALSPVELDVYSRVVAAQQHTTEQVSRARQHHLERLRYEAALAERQFLRVDPLHWRSAGMRHWRNSSGLRRPRLSVMSPRSHCFRSAKNFKQPSRPLASIFPCSGTRGSSLSLRRKPCCAASSTKWWCIGPPQNGFEHVLSGVEERATSLRSRFQWDHSRTQAGSRGDGAFGTRTERTGSHR
jgi:DNA invertase Pin-like site-specific DNA recombinase